jgi:hypothetical protein
MPFYPAALPLFRELADGGSMEHVVADVGGERGVPRGDDVAAISPAGAGSQAAGPPVA